MIHFELTGADLTEEPGDALWQAQRKSFMLQLAIKLENHYSFKDERRSPEMSVFLHYCSLALQVGQICSETWVCFSQLVLVLIS